MLENLQKVTSLGKSGKLHRKLIIRIWLFVILTLVFLGLTVYDVIFKNLPLLPVVIIGIIGMILGRFVFTHITKVVWSEEEQVITTGRLDLLGIVVLIVYVIVRLSTHWLLEHIYHNVVLISGLTFTSIFGGFLGRYAGLLSAVVKTHIKSEKPL